MICRMQQTVIWKQKSSDELIAELKKVLYVSKVQKEHEILYGQDWQRVYTTNYDEVPILASKGYGRTALCGYPF